jgi:hypothetical protein
MPFQPFLKTFYTNFGIMGAYPPYANEISPGD